MNRPDFSMYLAHFTKNGRFFNEDQEEPVQQVEQMTAKERLFSILENRNIFSSNMPWTNLPSICFTECPWSSLLAHTKNYSPFGIGFTKEFIFKNGGAPALYMRANLFKKISKKKPRFKKDEKEIWTFVTPFAPIYGKYNVKRCLGKYVDYTHEREWRVPQNLSFEYSDIAFVILKSIDDFETMPSAIKTGLQAANTKIIIMDNYRLVEELWPVHKIDQINE